MKFKPRIKLVISVMLSILLIFPTALLADSVIDYEGHYAEDSIKELFKEGIITGYVDGSFKPEKEISRAEFMAIVNRAFNFNEEAEIDFADVKEGKWHYEHVARAVKAGYIKGFTDGTMRPTANISRQEAAVVIARILDLEKGADTMVLSDLKDTDKIQEWGAKGIAAIISKGYISVNKEGAFEPAENLTRADMAIAVAKSYTKGIKKLYAKPGIFRGGIIDGNVKIDNKNITLMDTEITGDLILGEGIGDGDVRLYNVKVKGETIVKGGGEDSIIIENCEFTKIIIVKEDGKIRVLVKGNTTIDETEVQSGAKLETDKVTGEGFGYVTIAEGLEGDTLIELIGNFEDIEIQAEGVQIQASGGTIGNLTIAKGAKDLDINLAKNSKVTILSAQESVVVKGEGIVDKVDAPKGVKVEVPKKETHTPTTRGGGGGGRGGSGGEDAPSTIAVSAISVEGVPVIGQTLTATSLRPDGASVDYQWQRAVKGEYGEYGEYVDIDGATDATYKLGSSVNEMEPSSAYGLMMEDPTHPDEGAKIRLKVTGKDRYRGTAYSEPLEIVDYFVAPANNSTIKVGEKITVYATGADDLRIMLWPKELNDVEAAEEEYEDKIFSSRIDKLRSGGMTIVRSGDVFEIAICQELINMLEKGTKYKADGSPELDKYDWLSGDKTSWIITPETGNEIWEGYNTWNEEKVGDTFFVYTLVAEYHTYKFNIEDMADEHIVSEGLEDPTNVDFEDMEPVKLSIARDEIKDRDYKGNVRVAPVDCKNLQLWAKDTAGNWYDINEVGWGPPEGWVMDIDGGEPIEVYVIATEEFDGNVTIELEDIDGDYGAANDIIISQEVAVKAREPEHSEYEFKIGENTTVLELEVDELIADNSVVVTGDGNVTEPGEVTDNALTALAAALGNGYSKVNLASRLVEVTLKAKDVKELGYDKVRILPLEIEEIHGEGNTSDLQVWMYASQHDKKWWNIAKSGWGSKGTGFKLDWDENSEMKAYIFGKTPGVYKITFEAVDTSEDDEPVIATGTAMVKVTDVVISGLTKNCYVAEDELKFSIAINGFKPNKEEKISMMIYSGNPQYDIEPIDLEGSMTRVSPAGKTEWLGTTDEYGKLTVSGTVNPGLPYGELHIILPNHGGSINNSIPLQDNDGENVHVGGQAG